MTDPLTIRVDDSILDDLDDRLARARFPEPSDAVPWSAGTDPRYLRELVHYWRTEFDWRVVELSLNDLPHRLVDIAGTRVHVVHVRAARGRAGLPLVLTHGWPSAFIEMLPLVGPLTDPVAHGGADSDAFDVVIPSLPGFGFSGVPDAPLTRSQIAGMWAAVMTELGYDTFGAFGGDIGGDVSNWLGIEHPDRIIGLHLIHPGIPPIARDDPSLAADELRFYAEVDAFDEQDGGYSAMQATRPDTLAAALIDSPSGLAAWIVDKFRAWSDCHGELDSAIDRDTLLSIITLYWVTGTIGSSFRTYYDYRHNRPRTRIHVPVGVTLSVEENLPRSLVERLYSNLRQWREPGKGGHFMALEQPDQLVRDLRDFFRPLRR